MGIQTIGSQSNGQLQPPHLQPSPAAPLSRQGSWYNLTLGQVEGQLGKPLGSMNLDELLKNVWSAEAASLSVATESSSSASSSLQRQASLTLARALSGKTVDDVWNEILQGQRRRFGEEVKSQVGDQTLFEVTLEDFLVKAGLFADPAIGPGAAEAVMPISFQPPHQTGMSSMSSPSVGALSDATASSGRKRDSSDAYERNLERRLRRKIKNRESAARSRARKQAYHNELVTKVSRLEEENLKLKREKEIDEKIFPMDNLPEPRYQLRRTSSASF